MTAAERPGDAGSPRHDRGSARRRSGPRNYLAPAERRRLFVQVMPAAAVLVVALGWLERAWLPRRGGDDRGQVDTRLDAVAGSAVRGDEVRIEGDPPPPESPADADLAASLDALARVRDATMFRDADNDAWFQVWTTLRQQGAPPPGRPAVREVTFRELFGQPRSFRGRLVRMRGTLHRAEQLDAPRNDYGVDRYWQCWMEPAGGPSSPVVIQCLTLPEGMRSGLAITEPVEVTGYFFKNFAYNAADAIRVAPVIMTLAPRRMAVAPPPAGFAGPGGVALALAAALAVFATAAWLGTAAGRRRPPRPLPADPADLDALLAHVEPVSVDESLRRLAAGQRAASGPGPDASAGAGR